VPRRFHAHGESDHADELTELIRSDAWMMRVLRALADLLDGVWRRNPRRVDIQQSLARLARHQPATRWPRVSVVPPE
jgi:hypothetical protein